MSESNRSEQDGSEQDRDERNSAPAADPSASDILGAALADAARRAGLDPATESSTGQVVWATMGGWRGVLEAVLPSLAFVVIFTVSQELLLSLVISVGLALVFTAIRLVQRSSASAAFGGLVATGAAAGLALWTGRAQDNFVPGLVTNAVYGTAFLVSALIGWSLIGLAAGFLMGEGTAWRRDPRQRRVFFWLALAWAGLFYARLAVQLPLYLAGEVTALGTLKLIMGLPLFAPLIAVTWLAARAVYPRRETDARSGAE